MNVEVNLRCGPQAMIEVVVCYGEFITNDPILVRAADEKIVWFERGFFEPCEMCANLIESEDQRDLSYIRFRARLCRSCYNAAKKK